MHGLWAFAAPHLAYLHPKHLRRCPQAGEKHQTIALQTFRSVLSAPVDVERVDALFALAATLSMSSMARSCALSATAPIDMGAVAELIILTKGIANVIQLSQDRIGQGPMAGMLAADSRYPKGTPVHLPLSVSSCLETIRLMMSMYGLDRDTFEHCRSDCVELDETHKTTAYFAAKGDIETSTTSLWQIQVPMGYVRLVQECSPPALVVLAHYAAAITAIRNAWYMQGWAEIVMNGIGQLLDSEMQHWLHRPRQQLQDEMKELGVC